MRLPNQYLVIRQPRKACEVALVTAGKPDSVLFSGGRVAAKKFLSAQCLSIGFEHLEVYCLKRSGALVKISG